MANGNLLLTFNAGSSTVKIGLFETKADKARRIGKGLIDFRRRPLTFHLTQGPTTLDRSLQTDAGEQLHQVVDETFGILSAHFDMSTLSAIGHRVVHGGDLFTGPVPLDEARIRDIEGLTALAPLHQPQALRLIRAVRHLRPALAQTASFDTAFHATQSDLCSPLRSAARAAWSGDQTLRLSRPFLCFHRRRAAASYPLHCRRQGRCRPSWQRGQPLRPRQG